MAFLIIVGLIFVVASFFISAGVLLLIGKLFKIENPTYKNSLKVVIFSSIITVIVAIIFGLLNLGSLSSFLAEIASICAFYYFLEKYYHSTGWKSIGIYFVYVIAIAIISLLIVIPTRLYLVEPFVVNGESMSPTYHKGDYLLINKLNKSFERGDIVVFKRLAGDKNKFFIKRIIGLPLEKIEIKDGNVLINEQILKEGYVGGKIIGDISITLNQYQYFVLSDNQDKDFDPITKLDILGKILYKVSGLAK